MSTGADIFDLDVPRIPTSLNAMGIGTRGSRMKYYRLKQEMENDIIICCNVAQVPKGLTKVHATAVIRFANRRKRDEGNFRWFLEKCLGDALQTYGALEDDTADEFTFGGVTFDKKCGIPRSVITLETWR